jgi:hypothetical protein
MPVKLRIYLEGDPPSHPFQHMAGLRKLVLDWLALAGGAALATTVHDANQPNPDRKSTRLNSSHYATSN